MARNTHWSTMEDRLSSLPDEILTNILSHLPTYSAIKTPLISRRWRNLWKSITTFQSNTSDIQFEKASQLLNVLSSANTRVFDYTFCGKPTKFNWQSAEHLILLLIRRNVEVLKLRSVSIVSTCAFIPVPKCVFKSQSLVVLELDGTLDCDFKFNDYDETSVNLPNLRKLVLRVQAQNWDYSRTLLRILLKSCPLIEDLRLRLELSDIAVTDWYIIAPNLKMLNIEVMVPSSSSSIIIDAPELVKLKIRDPCSYYDFDSIPTRLLKASFNLKRIEGTDWFPTIEHHVYGWSIAGHDLALSEFVRGMCSVRYLKLQCYANMHSFFRPRYNQEMAVFPYLTVLKTTIGGLDGWEDLLRSLHCFPNLEHLELKLDDFHITIGSSSWVAPIVLPDCLLSKLKRITVRKAKRNIQEVKLLEFILNHSNVLEELRIYGPSGSLMENNMTQSELLWAEYKFCHALFKLPRSSLNCEIVVSGVYINASSNALENKEMNCLISFEKLQEDLGSG